MYEKLNEEMNEQQTSVYECDEWNIYVIPQGDYFECEKYKCCHKPKLVLYT